MIFLTKIPHNECSFSIRKRWRNALYHKDAKNILKYPQVRSLFPDVDSGEQSVLKFATEGAVALTLDESVKEIERRKSTPRSARGRRGATRRFIAAN